MSTLTVDSEGLLSASRWELQSAAVLAVSGARPAVAAEYLRLADSLAGLLNCGAGVSRCRCSVDLQSLYSLSDSVERAGDRAALRDWEELDCLTGAVWLLLELADATERGGL